MGKLIDLTGKIFGRLTVIKRADANTNQNKPRWVCRCTCGKEVVVDGNSLKSGHIKSCGCYQLEIRTKHGMSNTKIYRTWQAMKDRCYNPKNKKFPRYGGRGIKVCERWHIFENFYADVSILPHFGEPGYTLDRIENDKDYEPGNVRWATPAEQNRNYSRNIKIEYNGEEMTLAEAAEKSGIAYPTLQGRYRRGKRGDELLKTVGNYNKKNKGS